MGHKKEGNSKKTWSSAQACFNGIGTKESLEIEGNPVMEAWEEPYMKVLADKVIPILINRFTKRPMIWSKVYEYYLEQK